MTRKPPPGEDFSAYLGSMVELLVNGYTDEVKAFTQSIQTNPGAVLRFESAFDVITAEAMVHWEETPSQEALLNKAVDSAESLDALLEGIGRPVETYLEVINHGREATFEIGWRDHVVGTVVWDLWVDEIDDPVMAFAGIGFLFDTKLYHCAAKATEKPQPPMYRYHPERFKAYRGYADPVGKFYRQRVDPASGMMTVEQLNEVMQLVITELSQRSMKYPRRLKDDHPSPTLVVQAEETLATANGHFVQAGRQIMDFPPALTEMLAKTDVDDIPLNTIKLPYAAQYLHFGPQNGLELEPGWLVDGVYVERRGQAGDVRFTVTAVPFDQDQSRVWYLFPEAEYTQDFVGDFRTMDLATAIDTVLSDRLAGLQVKHAGLAEPLGEMPGGAAIEDVGPKMAVLREDITRRRHPVYKTALQLAVNALCYITAYPDDIEAVWPSGTPASLKQKAEEGTGKEKTRAKSKLAALGYVPVHICGRQIVQQREALGIHPQQHGHVATHWRRGHWRNQVHGPARALRKLIWVMPTIVGSKGGSEPEDGHLYLVS